MPKFVANRRFDSSKAFLGPSWAIMHSTSKNVNFQLVLYDFLIAFGSFRGHVVVILAHSGVFLGQRGVTFGNLGPLRVFTWLTKFVGNGRFDSSRAFLGPSRAISSLSCVPNRFDIVARWSQEVQRRLQDGQG